MSDLLSARCSACGFYASSRCRHPFGPSYCPYRRSSQPDYDAAMADIEAAYPGINDDGTCRHGARYDQCPICAPTDPEDAAPCSR